jgi:DNA invertase Pin-like site-specific DNA recombinase
VHPRERLTLEDLARRAAVTELELQRIRDELRAVKVIAGLPPTTPERRERRERVLQLRAQGYSQRAISLVLGIGQTTVYNDLRALDVPAARLSRGLDGGERRHQPPGR